MSLTKSSVFESGDQNAVRIGRMRSAVSGRALDMSSDGATHTFSTPSRGAIHDSHFPSGLSRPAVLVGLPKNLARSMSGTSEAGCAEAAAVRVKASKADTKERIMEPTSWIAKERRC